MNALGRVLHEIRADVAAARDRDPAAQGVSTVEILVSWAGVQALLAHRVARALRDAGVPVAPRCISYLAARSPGSRSTRRRRSATSSSSTTGPVW